MGAGKGVGAVYSMVTRKAQVRLVVVAVHVCRTGANNTSWSHSVRFKVVQGDTDAGQAPAGD